MVIFSATGADITGRETYGILDQIQRVDRVTDD
jgi:hypothetical protein